jgi:Tfp pilus assembly protein PilN
MANRILAIEFGRTSTQAVVVARSGESAQVQAAARVEAQGREDPAEAIRRVLESIDSAPRACVIVTPMVQTFTCQLGIPPGQVASMSADQIGRAARFEVEPYIEFAVDEGLFTVDVITRKTRANVKTTPVRVSVVYRKQYEILETVCKKAGLKLRAAYPSDMSFAFAGPRVEDPNTFVLTLDLREEGSRAALANGADLLAARNIPVLLQDGFGVQGDGAFGVAGNADEAAGNIVATLSEFGGDWASPSEIILTGPAADEAIAASLDQQMAASTVRRWSPEVTTGRVQSSVGHVEPHFASAIGAAVQEFDLSGGRSLGLNSSMSPVERVRQGMSIAPLIVVILLVLIFVGHYIVMRASLQEIEKAHQEKAGESKQLQGRVNQLAAMRSEIQSAQMEKSELKRQIEFLESLGEREDSLAGEILLVVSERIPQEVVLTSLVENADVPGRYNLKGYGLRPSFISAFAADLQGAPKAKAVSIRGITEVDESPALRTRGGNRNFIKVGAIEETLPSGSCTFELVIDWTLPLQ